MADEPEVTSADDLFLIAPDRFTAARNALAKSLKAIDKAAAAEVARRKRPSATAWALNVVARGEPVLIDELLAAADELKAALASGEGDAVREAQREQRSQLERVVQAATRQLAEHGQSTGATNDQRLRSTLQAAVVDDDIADSLRAGRLDRDFEASGFGFTATAATPLVQTEPAARHLVAIERYEKLAETADELEAEASQLADRAGEAQVAFAEAEAALADAERRAREARAAAERAAARASAARAKADAARPDE